MRNNHLWNMEPTIQAQAEIWMKSLSSTVSNLCGGAHCRFGNSSNVRLHSFWIRLSFREVRMITYFLNNFHSFSQDIARHPHTFAISCRNGLCGQGHGSSPDIEERSHRRGDHVEEGKRNSKNSATRVLRRHRKRRYRAKWFERCLVSSRTVTGSAGIERF